MILVTKMEMNPGNLVKNLEDLGLVVDLALRLRGVKNRAILITRSIPKKVVY